MRMHLYMHKFIAISMSYATSYTLSNAKSFVAISPNCNAYIYIHIYIYYVLQQRLNIKWLKAYLAQGLAQETCARPSCSRKGLAQGLAQGTCARNILRKATRKDSRKARARLAQESRKSRARLTQGSHKARLRSLAQTPCARNLRKD